MTGLVTDVANLVTWLVIAPKETQVSVRVFDIFSHPL